LDDKNVSKLNGWYSSRGLILDHSSCFVWKLHWSGFKMFSVCSLYWKFLTTFVQISNGNCQMIGKIILKDSDELTMYILKKDPKTGLELELVFSKHSLSGEFMSSF
jgi:hypothetical protein